MSISDRLKPIGIGRWPVWISEIDCSTLSSPRVTMNGCTPVLTTRMPTRQPIAIGSRSITRMATTVLLPPEIIFAPMTLESVAAAPTDRSSCPAIMISVIPTVMRPSTATLDSRTWMLSSVR